MTKFVVLFLILAASCVEPAPDGLVSPLAPAGRGQLSVQVWTEQDCDSIFEPGAESPIAGATVQVQDLTNQQAGQIRATNRAGDVVFSGLDHTHTHSVTARIGLLRGNVAENCKNSVNPREVAPADWKGQAAPFRHEAFRFKLVGTPTPTATATTTVGVQLLPATGRGD